MTNVQKELDKAFQMLMAIHVNGDSVELMAGAKEHLRTAYKLAGEEKESENG